MPASDWGSPAVPAGNAAVAASGPQEGAAGGGRKIRLPPPSGFSCKAFLAHGIRGGPAECWDLAIESAAVPSP